MRMESVSAAGSARLVHLVAPLGGAEMRQPGAGDSKDARDPGGRWAEDAALLERGGEIDRLADAALGDDIADRGARIDRLTRQFEGRARAFDQAAFAARGDDERALVVFVDDLSESHGRSLCMREGARWRAGWSSRGGALTSSRRFATARIPPRRSPKPPTWIFPPKRRREPCRKSPGPFQRWIHRRARRRN